MATFKIETVSTSRFTVWQQVVKERGLESCGRFGLQECECPIADLTEYIAAGELKELGTYLEEQGLFTFASLKEFPAAGRKHANAIELQDRTGYGDGGTWPTSFGFHECRARRGSAEFWRHNANAERLPGLVNFVGRLPFFKSTGKVTIILSNAGDTGVEHVDHKFDDLVSEFVWLRMGVGPRKKFFVRDAEGNKHYVEDKEPNDDGACLWFDDHFPHSIDAIDQACYSIRVDGVFTDTFRKHLCRVGTFCKQSIGGATQGGLRAVLGAQGSVPLSVSAARSLQTANVRARAACNGREAGMAAVEDELKDAYQRIAELEAALKEKEDLQDNIRTTEVVPRPPYLGPPRGLCDDSLFCAQWAEATRPLYELQMGTENMAPLLYSIIRFTKPEKVLEVGSGFTTIFALQALSDNDNELGMYQRFHRNSQEGTFAWPKLNWVNEGYMQRSGGYIHSELHCVDNMAHTGTTARLVSTVADALGLEDRLRFTVGDAMETATCEQLVEELGGEGRVGLLWIDFGDGDRLDEVLLDHGYWDLVNPDGGLVMVHSALTNASSREWLARMKQLACSDKTPSHMTGEDADVPSMYGPFEVLSLMEPHKMRQNSVTMLRRKGRCAQEPYEEPIFTQYA